LGFIFLSPLRWVCASASVSPLGRLRLRLCRDGYLEPEGRFVDDHSAEAGEGAEAL
jgi:hypothetical protein